MNKKLVLVNCKSLQYWLTDLMLCLKAVLTCSSWQQPLKAITALRIREVWMSSSPTPEMLKRSQHCRDCSVTSSINFRLSFYRNSMEFSLHHLQSLLLMERKPWFSDWWIIATGFSAFHFQILRPVYINSLISEHSFWKLRAFLLFTVQVTHENHLFGEF